MTFRDVIGVEGDGVPAHLHDAADISGEAVFADLTVDHLLSGTIRGKEIVVAGGADGVIRSDNFDAGVDGWQILGDGSAEFNDITIRGDLVSGSGDDLFSVISGDVTIGGGDNSVEILPSEFDLGGTRIDLYGSISAAKTHIGRISAVSPGRFVLAAFSGSDLELITSGDLKLDGAQILLPDGSASTPAIAFVTDTDTGITRPTTDALEFVAGGVRVGFLNESGGAAALVDFAGIAGNTTGNAANVHVTNPTGRLLRSTSSARYKTAIRPWDRRSSVLDLEPSLFRSKAAADDSRRVRLGLIAEDVAEQFPLAAIYDDEGRPDAINWDAVVAGLIAEVQALRKELAHAAH